MNREAIMEILSQLEGTLDDSIMEDVATKNPTACITIKITGPKGTQIESEAEEPEEAGKDTLDARLAAVSRGRNSLDGEKRK